MQLTLTQNPMRNSAFVDTRSPNRFINAITNCDKSKHSHIIPPCCCCRFTACLRRGGCMWCANRVEKHAHIRLKMKLWQRQTPIQIVTMRSIVTAYIICLICALHNLGVFSVVYVKARISTVQCKAYTKHIWINATQWFSSLHGFFFNGTAFYSAYMMVGFSLFRFNQKGPVCILHKYIAVEFTAKKWWI